mgnify:CR=1 FL=1
MAISDKILEYRQKNKLTQKELGELLNVSDKVISRWERGVTLPDVEMLKNISDELDISISELYDSIENSKDKYDYYMAHFEEVEQMLQKEQCSIV